MKRVKKQRRIVKFNAPLLFGLLLFVACAGFLVVSTDSTLAAKNLEVERQKSEIKTQEKKNESLKMKINELASLDKIQEIAKEQGLSYNNDNIKSITE